MELGKIYKKMWAGVWSGLAFILVGYFIVTFGENFETALVIGLILLLVGFAFLIAAAIYASLRLRCPHCNTALRFKGRKPNFCPKCGGKIEW